MKVVKLIQDKKATRVLKSYRLGYLNKLGEKIVIKVFTYSRKMAGDLIVAQKEFVRYLKRCEYL